MTEMQNLVKSEADNKQLLVYKHIYCSAVLEYLNLPHFWPHEFTVITEQQEKLSSGWGVDYQQATNKHNKVSHISFFRYCLKYREKMNYMFNDRNTHPSLRFTFSLL